jgi:hypothetical protein
MPILDNCINSQYEPGNIGSSSGTAPTIITVGTLYSPDSYPFDTVTYLLDFSKFYDSMYHHYGYH